MTGGSTEQTQREFKDRWGFESGFSCAAWKQSSWQGSETFQRDGVDSSQSEGQAASYPNVGLDLSGTGCLGGGEMSPEGVSI